LILVYTKPWSKESERILRQLTQNGRAYATEKKGLSREFGIHCKEIIEADMLDVATVRNKNPRKNLFVIPPNTVVVPKKGKFFFYKIF